MARASVSLEDHLQRELSRARSANRVQRVHSANAGLAQTPWLGCIQRQDYPHVIRSRFTGGRLCICLVADQVREMPSSPLGLTDCC